MRNIFIAIGGSGAKVGEALVRALACGFPTSKVGEDGTLTSAGGTLEFWVVDPDTDSAATTELADAIKQYKDLEDLLVEGWSKSIDKEPRLLDPLDLPGVSNTGKTLRELLNAGGSQSTEPFLDLFYDGEELDIKVDRGFYQKPFIGAAVMAMFAESLTQGTASGGLKDLFNQLREEQVNFFVCGSLHGGTGASGVPVIGQFLRTEKDKTSAPWRLASCLLGPYRLPLAPPFEGDGSAITDTLIAEKARFFEMETEANKPYRNAYVSLGPVEQKQLIRQILLGFYANPEEICERAHQGLLYYHNKVLNRKDIGRIFDDIYLISKPQPLQVTEWSNGGKSQANPLDSAEVCAALTALSFFSGAAIPGGTDYVVAASTEEREDRLTLMHLYDLPRYCVDGVNIDAERALLATATLSHFLLSEIPWEVPAKRWTGIEGLRSQYLCKTGEELKRADVEVYQSVAMTLIRFLRSLVDPSRTKGWHPDCLKEIDRLVSQASMENMAKAGFANEEPTGRLNLGLSSIGVTAFQIGDWYPEGKNKGEALRHIWMRLYAAN